MVLLVQSQLFLTNTRSFDSLVVVIPATVARFFFPRNGLWSLVITLSTMVFRRLEKIRTTLGLQLRVIPLGKGLGIISFWWIPKTIGLNDFFSSFGWFGGNPILGHPHSLCVCVCLCPCPYLQQITSIQSRPVRSIDNLHRWESRGYRTWAEFRTIITRLFQLSGFVQPSKFGSGRVSRASPITIRVSQATYKLPHCPS